jgi:arylsulfatase
MITRRNALKALTGAAAAPAVLRSARRAGDKPNLLFLWTDQQRADTLRCYGNRSFQMPALNRFASECVIFDRAYVTQPVCTPSRSSIMTGWWPHQSGCIRNNIALRRDTGSLPELLGDAGYRTGYMGKWHLGDEVFAQHGFEEWKAVEDGYEQHYSAGRDGKSRSAYHAFLKRLGYAPNDSGVYSRSFVTKAPVEHSKPSFLANEASNFLLAHRNEPWMLYVNTLEPHTPFSSALNELHSEVEAPLPPNYPGIPTKGEPVWYQRRRAGFMEKFEGVDLKTRAGFQRIARNYAGLCALVDQAYNRILWTLEASGQAENTIVVFTSDHGEMMGAHSLVTKQVMYEEAVRVPYLMRVPFRKQKPHRVSQPVSHIDTVPTLLELLGRKEAAEGLPGRSLVPALAGDTSRHDPVFLEWHQDEKDSGAGPNGRTVITPEGHKLVWYDSDQSMLFDRAKDPLEMHNVLGASEYASVEKRLRASMEAWRKSVKDPLPL